MDSVPHTVVKVHSIRMKNAQILLNDPKIAISLHFSIILLALVKVFQYNLTIPFGAGQRCVVLKG